MIPRFEIPKIKRKMMNNTTRLMRLRSLSRTLSNRSAINTTEDISDVLDEEVRTSASVRVNYDVFETVEDLDSRNMRRRFDRDLVSALPQIFLSQNIDYKHVQTVNTYNVLRGYSETDIYDIGISLTDLANLIASKNSRSIFVEKNYIHRGDRTLIIYSEEEETSDLASQQYRRRVDSPRYHVLYRMTQTESENG